MPVHSGDREYAVYPPLTADEAGGGYIARGHAAAEWRSPNRATRQRVINRLPGVKAVRRMSP